MKSFFATIAILAAMMARQAMAGDAMLDIEWEDGSDFKLEESSTLKCGMSFHPFLPVPVILYDV